MDFDECIFCERELEEFHYNDIIENMERAETKEGLGLKICKKCAKRLKGILDVIALEDEA